MVRHALTNELHSDASKNPFDPRNLSVGPNFSGGILGRFPGSEQNPVTSGLGQPLLPQPGFHSMMNPQATAILPGAVPGQMYPGFVGSGAYGAPAAGYPSLLQPPVAPQLPVNLLPPHLMMQPATAPVAPFAPPAATPHPYPSYSGGAAISGTVVAPAAIGTPAAPPPPPPVVDRSAFDAVMQAATQQAERKRAADTPATATSAAPASVVPSATLTKKKSIQINISGGMC